MAVRDRTVRTWFSRHGASLCLTALVLLAVGLNQSWIASDSSIMTMSDSYSNLVRLLRFVDRPPPRGLGELWDALGSLSIGGRPPLYPLLSSPLITILGRSEDAALTINNLFLALLIVSTFGIGKLARGPWTGLLAALVVCTYPPIVHIHRTYSPHTPIPACVALSTLLLLHLLRTRSILSAWLFGGSLAFGLLIHPTFSWIMAVPTLLFSLYAIFFQTEPHRPCDLRNTVPWAVRKLREPMVLFGLMPATIAASFAVAGWYLAHGRPLLRRLLTMQSEQLADFRDFAVRTLGFPEVEPSFWWYAQTAPGVISLFFTAAFALALVHFLTHQPTRTASVLLVTFASGYAGFSLFSSRAWLLFACVLPAVAVLTALWTTRSRRRWISTTLALISVIIAAFNYSVVTWGVQSKAGTTVATALGARLDMPGCRLIRAYCQVPARQERWPIPEALETVLRDESCLGESCDTFLVPSGRYQLFRFVLVRDFPNRQLDIRTLSGRSYGAQYDFRALLESDYLYAQHTAPREPSGREYGYPAATYRLLNGVAPPAFENAHREVARFELPNNRVGKLIKRTAPLTIAEARQTIDALEIAAKYKETRFELLAELYRERGELAEALVQLQLGENAARSQRQRFRLLHRMGSLHLDLGKPEAAIQPLKTAIRLNPEASTSRILLGLAYLRTGRSDDAVFQLREAIALEPTTLWARRVLAGIYRERHDKEEAQMLYQEILEIRPGDAEARARLDELDAL